MSSLLAKCGATMDGKLFADGPIFASIWHVYRKWELASAAGGQEPAAAAAAADGEAAGEEEDSLKGWMLVRRRDN